MNDKLIGIIEILEDLVDDLPSKSKLDLNTILTDLRKPVNIEKLLKIQDELEYFSNHSNIDSFARNEIINIIAEIETLY